MWWRKKKQAGHAALRLQEAVALQQRGRFTEAQDKLEESIKLLRKTKDKPSLARALSQLSQVHFHQGALREAIKCVSESAAIRTELPDFRGLAIDYQTIGTLMMSANQLDQAHGFFVDSLGLATGLGDQTLIASSESNLGIVAYMRGQYLEAEQHFGRSQEIRKQQHDKLGYAKNLNHIGKIKEATGLSEEAATLYEESLSLLRVLGAPEAAIALDNLNKVRRRK
jgi:tetratricopeptide (TPR) repeat protein